MPQSSPGFFVRLLLVPLRLATGWGRPIPRLGLVGAMMLVLLRLCIGFHFYSEGMDKIHSNFDAGLFFANARGPFAAFYQQQIWDWDGRIRLDRERTVQHWANYREQMKKHYGLEKSEEGQKNIDLAYVRAQTQLDWILTSNKAEIEEFQRGRERIAALEQDVVRDRVSSLGGQRETIRREWQRLIAPIFKQIDDVWDNYERESNRVGQGAGTSSQTRYYSLGRPRDEPIDTRLINPIIPYFDLTVGVCLMLGFFTPVVALVAAAFLGSVFLSQYPPVTGPGSTLYHLAEGAGCLVLASTGAGRIGGLDFILYALCGRWWPPRTGA